MQLGWIMSQSFNQETRTEDLICAKHCAHSPFLSGTSVSAAETNNTPAKSTGKMLKEITRVGGDGEMAGRQVD